MSNDDFVNRLQRACRSAPRCFSPDVSTAQAVIADTSAWLRRYFIEVGKDEERVRVLEAIEKLKREYDIRQGGKLDGWDSLDELEDELGLSSGRDDVSCGLCEASNPGEPTCKELKKKYPSCNAVIDEFCGKHGVVHRASKEKREEGR